MASLPVTRSQALAIALALVGVLVVGGRLLSHRGGTAAVPAHTFPAASSAAPVARLVVDVVGAVRRPGLYRLGSGSRVADALERAGGATVKADLDQVNLAAPVADGEQVVVPRKVAGGAAAGATPSAGAGAGRTVQLSTATLEQLDALPGIGPVTAQKILDYRTQHGAFSSVDELDAIPGIGPARIDQLRGLVVP
jgi:competence protein ComEA